MTFPAAPESPSAATTATGTPPAASATHPAASALPYRKTAPPEAAATMGEGGKPVGDRPPSTASPAFKRSVGAVFPKCHVVPQAVAFTKSAARLPVMAPVVSAAAVAGEHPTGRRSTL